MRRLQKKEKGTSEAKKLSKVEKERELRKAKAEKMSKAEKGKGVEKSKGKCKKGGDLAEKFRFRCLFDFSICFSSCRTLAEVTGLVRPCVVFLLQTGHVRIWWNTIIMILMSINTPSLLHLVSSILVLVELIMCIS